MDLVKREEVPSIEEYEKMRPDFRRKMMRAEGQDRQRWRSRDVSLQVARHDAVSGAGDDARRESR